MAYIRTIFAVKVCPQVRLGSRKRWLNPVRNTKKNVTFMTAIAAIRTTAGSSAISLNAQASTSSPAEVPYVVAASRKRRMRTACLALGSGRNSDLIMDDTEAGSRASSLGVRSPVPEALFEMPLPRKVALVENPRIAALGVREDFPGVVVSVPEVEAVGSVHRNGPRDLVQPPLLRLLAARLPGRVDV